MKDLVIVVGASARAAAVSLARAGQRVCAADLFADRDLQECCSVQQLVDYPDGICAAVQRSGAAACFPVGGMENHPRLLEKIGRVTTLLASPVAAVRRVRDPFELAAILRAGGLPALEVRDTRPTCDRSARGCPDKDQWVRKPWKSCGGSHVVMLDATVETPPAGDPESRTMIYQRFAPGRVFGATLLAQPSGVELLGVSRQWSGKRWAGASGFQYAGSLGPLPVPAIVRARLLAIAKQLVAATGLLGVFGLDFALARTVAARGAGADGAADADRVALLEVNPRYPASAELLERATGTSIAAAHVAACLGHGAEPLPPADRIWAKAILYAPRDVRIEGDLRRTVTLHGPRLAWGESALLADVPQSSQTIARGRPVTTVLAGGRSIESTGRRLAAALRAVRRALSAS